MARLTKTQLEICGHLLNGGWIWTTTSGHAYLAVKMDERVRSTALNNRVFTGLKNNGIIVPKTDNPNHFILA